MDTPIKDIPISPDVKASIDSATPKPVPDTVLQVVMTPDGGISWHIPNDLIRATFLLKILELVVSQMLDAHISAAQTTKLIKPKFSIFGRK